MVGGQRITWTQQGLQWMVPAQWKQMSADSRTFHYMSPGTSEAGNLIVSISPMPASFPIDVSLKATYDANREKIGWGEYAEVKYLDLDGVKGVLTREATPEHEENPQRLMWLGYRDYNGQMQLVNVMLASRAKDFPRHEDTFLAILKTTRLAD